MRGVASALEGRLAAEGMSARALWLRGWARPLDPATWMTLIEREAPVVEALEAGLVEHVDHPVLTPFVRRDLLRSPMLRRTLRLARRRDARTCDVADHVARLRELTERRPARLLAHLHALHYADLTLSVHAARALRRSGAPTALVAFNDDAPRDLGAFRAELASYFAAVPRAAAGEVREEWEVAWSLRAAWTPRALRERTPTAFTFRPWRFR